MHVIGFKARMVDTPALLQRNETRSQTVARIADCTASQHLWGYVTSSVT